MTETQAALRQIIKALEGTTVLILVLVVPYNGAAWNIMQRARSFVPRSVSPLVCISMEHSTRIISVLFPFYS